ncbi:MAG: hypothetical protein HY815_01320 [Candidatus Riflebacteria bacterium]|nr:hypothetical protein [Candidatus Riflebacteria bacterium]
MRAEGLSFANPRITVLAVALLCLVTGPVLAQYGYSPYQNSGYGYNQGYGQGYYNQGYANQGYYNQGYYQQNQGSWWDKLKNSFTGGTGSQGLGRTLGGAAGIAAGSFGGAALASAVIKAAGVASMGPIAPILVGTAITAGGAFLGGKLLSHGGSWMDRAMGPDMTWTLVGAIAGSVAGFALLPALGPFAGPAGRVIGAAVGGVAGGLLGKIFAPHLQKFATPNTIYAGTGALLGGLGFGIPGALIGAVGGYALGSIFDKNFFSEPGSSLSGDLRRNAVDFRQPAYALQNGANTITNWVSNTGNYVENRLRTPSYGYYGGYAYQPNTDVVGQGNPYVTRAPGYGTGEYNYTGVYAPQSTPTDGADTLAALKKKFLDAQATYQALEAAGDANRTAAYQQMMQARQAYEAAARQSR